MREWLVFASEQAILLIDCIALAVVLFASLQALVGALRLLRADSGHVRRAVWMRYGRWLVAGLTFQLAADIIESAISTEWEDIVRLGAVAVIRTFLNYFLERDIAEIRERDAVTVSTPPGADAARPAS